MAIDPISAFRGTSFAAGGGKVSGGSFADVLRNTGGTAGTAAQELEAYVKMTPAERMRVDLLKKLGLTEDDLAAMSPDEQRGVEAKLRELVQQQMQEASAKQETGQQAGQDPARRIDTLA